MLYCLKFLNIMKKTITAIFFALITILLCSCEKEGVYNPKKKISKICSVRCETWEWDGDLLKSITYSSGKTMLFNYNGKQLSGIVSTYSEISHDYTCYIFKYDKTGRHIVTIDEYIGGWIRRHNGLSNIFFETPKHTYHWEFHYNKDGKISECEETQYFHPWLYYKEENDVIDFISKYVVPIPPARKKMALYENKSTDNEIVDLIYTASFTYTGDNITEIHITGSGEEYTAQYVYTDYPNPFYKLLQPGISSFSFTDFKNKQLPVFCHTKREILFTGEILYLDYDYLYELEDGYPVTVQEKRKEYYFIPATETPDTNYSTTFTYYEYLP